LPLWPHVTLRRSALWVEGFEGAECASSQFSSLEIWSSLNPQGLIGNNYASLPLTEQRHDIV